MTITATVRQSDPQIQHSQLDNWAADLRHRPLPRSGLVVCWACSVAWRWKSSTQP